MAKATYKIPASIARSRLDHEISAEVWDINLRPTPIKVVLYWILILFVWMGLILKSPISSTPILVRILFTVWFFAAAVFYGRRSESGEMKFQQMPALLNYLPKAARNVLTRKTSDPFPFMSIVGIRSIDKNGTLHFIDGSVGRAFSVVGSASLLLFSDDRARMIDRVDSFWRKIDTDTNWIFLTTKEPQRVYRQVANVERQNQNLRPENRHPELRELMEEKYSILCDDVGGKFNSIHQYLVLRSDTMEHLHNAFTVLQAEVEGSSMFFKQCTILDGRSTLDMLGAIYHNRAEHEQRGTVARNKARERRRAKARQDKAKRALA